MIDYLTKYLLQYKRVSIPSVGTIHLVQQPPYVDVVGKLIYPPSVSTELRPDDAVPEHQLHFLEAAAKTDRDSLQQSLQQLGQRLADKIRSGGFNWNGIGLIRGSDDKVPVLLSALEPVPARKVIRVGAEHSVRVGEHERTSTQMAGLREEEKAERTATRKTSFYIGWIILALAILFILFILYTGKFRIGATGSKQPPTSWQASPVGSTSGLQFS